MWASETRGWRKFCPPLSFGSCSVRSFCICTNPLLSLDVPDLRTTTHPSARIHLLFRDLSARPVLGKLTRRDAFLKQLIDFLVGPSRDLGDGEEDGDPADQTEAEEEVA
jgi:hypothetical protein